MALFNIFKKTELFNKKEQDLILDSIKKAEENSSGEIRVYVERHCKDMGVVERAASLFKELSMGKTTAKNAVLIYVALKDKKYAIYGDSGIYEQFGKEFWEGRVQEFKKYFKEKIVCEAICEIVREIGLTLKEKFPFAGDEDVNELPNDVVFGN